MNEHDPILEAALEEVLAGQTPPDLTASTLARLEPSGPEVAPPSPRPVWRAWGAGIAAAACLVVGVVAAVEFGTAPDAKPEVAKQHNDADASQSDDESQGLSTLHLPSKTRDPNSPDVYFNTPSDTRNSGYSGNPPEASPNQPSHDPAINPHANPNGHVNEGYNPFVDTEDDALSTFALEHDAASFHIARRQLNEGKLPNSDAIRPEEFINAFDYDYPSNVGSPFEITMDAAPSRYGQNLKNSYVVRVGVQARDASVVERKPMVLTAVVDVSGSMDSRDRLPLVREALTTLAKSMTENDRLAIVIYGNDARVLLPMTGASDSATVNAAIAKLVSEGATNAEAGLEAGYKLAAENFTKGAVNRVMLFSDGVANVGADTPGGLLERIEERRRKGITLTTFGFGMGGYNDHLMEQLGDKGDGHYAYVAGEDDVKRLFGGDLVRTLQVVGRDVKIQVAFEPTVVKSYRLIGYVNRDVADKDFRNDQADGGEINAGHAATAIYEVKLHEGVYGEIARATLRYKTDEAPDAVEIEQFLGVRDVARDWHSASWGLRLAANAAEFAEILQENFYARGAELDAVVADLESLEGELSGRDEQKQVTDLLALVMKARDLKGETDD